MAETMDSIEGTSPDGGLDIELLVSNYDAEVARLTRRLMVATTRCLELEKRLSESEARDG